jgi:transmembrane protein 70, mitochondrial
MAEANLLHVLDIIMDHPEMCPLPFFSDVQVPSYIMWGHFSYCKPNYHAKQDNFSLVACLYGQTRWASQAAAVKQTEVSGTKISIGPKPKQIKEGDKDDSLVYEGPISSTIKKVKLLSVHLLSLCVTRASDNIHDLP